jgi:hypothetical protein
MRRMLAAGAAIVMCLALGGLPALAQEEATADEATTADVAPFHAVPDGSVVVEGTASCEISLGGEVSTEGEEAFLVVCTLDTSDPRVSGTERQDHYRLLAGRIGDGAVWVLDEALLTNDEGTWRGSVQAAEGWDSLPYGEAHYVGEGPYEGLEFHYYFFAPQVNDQAVVRGWISPISELPAA